MNNFHIIGSGACGFLRLHYLLKDTIPIKYKGGGPKYQNSFENWNDNGLIWDIENLSDKERLRRVSLHDTTTNITHSYIKYVPEFLKLHSNMKFLCFKGKREHSIKSLSISWGYCNPCYVKDRKLGIGHNRYAVDQFPNLSSCKDAFEATEQYWDEYYQIADIMSDVYPNNFFIVDAPKFFVDIEYRTKILSKVGVNINKPPLPVDFDSWNISTTLHGGLGNNLFQMGETISFCKKYNLPDPFFGIWDLWDGGGKYPSSYNSDRLFGGHSGTQDDIKKTFPNLDWRENLEANFDTKFMINDMFRFGRVEELEYVREKLQTNKSTELTKIFFEKTASLHLRFSGLPADDHSISPLDDSFYIECLKQIPEDVHVYLFSDDNSKMKDKLQWFQKNFPQNFSCVESDCFQTLEIMVECNYHILHVSTFSFWTAFLDMKQPNTKTFYPESFTHNHGKYMMPYKEWQMI
tara:strand:+ start:337 stop:1725 length:1389 start_codon:yes stop_codon:yes gene_type:complete